MKRVLLMTKKPAGKYLNSPINDIDYCVKKVMHLFQECLSEISQDKQENADTLYHGPK